MTDHTHDCLLGHTLATPTLSMNVTSLSSHPEKAIMQRPHLGASEPVPADAKFTAFLTNVPAILDPPGPTCQLTATKTPSSICTQQALPRLLTYKILCVVHGDQG
jgi:hypothetical protein